LGKGAVWTPPGGVCPGRSDTLIGSPQFRPTAPVGAHHLAPLGFRRGAKDLPEVAAECLRGKLIHKVEEINELGEVSLPSTSSIDPQFRRCHARFPITRPIPLRPRHPGAFVAVVRAGLATVPFPTVA
jgi:hypothetical protein